MSPEENLKLYESDVNAEDNIRQAITDAYQGLKPEIEQVRTFENQQFPAFYDSFQGYGAGTGAADLSPTALLQRATQNAANMSTTGQVARDAFDIRRAAMEDLIGKGMNQWQMGYAGADSAYNRWFQMQQFEEQKRQFNEQLKRMGSGGSSYGAPAWPTNPQPTNNNADLEAAYYDWLKDKNATYGGNAVDWSRPEISPKVTTGVSGLSGYAPSVPEREVVPTGNYQLDNIISRIR